MKTVFVSWSFWPVLFITCWVINLNAQSNGVLKVHPTNSRYFTDNSGKVIYLTGSHTWKNMVDGVIINGSPKPDFKYSEYLSALKQYGHNFIRFWSDSPGTRGNNGDGTYGENTPVAFQRTGPGTAKDGKPKYDLTKYNQTFFDRLRQRSIAARDQGFFVSIMLFGGWGTGYHGWWEGNTYIVYGMADYHSFAAANNINGINGNPNGDGSIQEIFETNVTAIRDIQKAYIRKVIDTVNDLDNVIYEIGNELPDGSRTFHTDMVSYIKSYEAGKPKQHLVGITSGGGSAAGGIDDPFMLGSNADWVSLGEKAGQKLDPPFSNNGSSGKPFITDTDHFNYQLTDRKWPWKAFARGHNPINMDPWDRYTSGVDPAYNGLRSALGQARTYANKIDLVSMTPQGNLASTGYCLARTGKEYLAYRPSSGSFTVSVTAGTYSYEWFNPGTGAVAGTGNVTAAGGNKSFTPPFSGEAVLYLKAADVTPCIQGPYQGIRVDLPGSVEVEDFDTCGGYYDLDPENQGGLYRPDEGVDIEDRTAGGGGFTIGYVRAGEWLAYSVNVTADDTYDIEIPVASTETGGTFHLEFDGVDKTGPVTVPATGGFDVWQTLTKQGITLTAGNQVMKLVMDTNGGYGGVGNFDIITVKEATTGITCLGTTGMNKGKSGLTIDRDAEGMVIFKLRLRQKGSYSGVVNDLRGSRVWNFRGETDNHRSGRAEWDQGRATGPGIYFVRVTQGTHTLVRKFILSH